MADSMSKVYVRNLLPNPKPTDTSGWSLDWVGNHKLATGPKAGALYIDGKEIKTV